MHGKKSLNEWEEKADIHDYMGWILHVNLSWAADSFNRNTSV